MRNWEQTICRIEASIWVVEKYNGLLVQFTSCSFLCSPYIYTVAASSLRKQLSFWFRIIWLRDFYNELYFPYKLRLFRNTTFLLPLHTYRSYFTIIGISIIKSYEGWNFTPILNSHEEMPSIRFHILTISLFIYLILCLPQRGTTLRCFKCLTLPQRLPLLWIVHHTTACCY